MRFDDVVIPLDAAWSSPFVRWQGPVAELSSLDVAAQVTSRALEGSSWDVDELVLGLTVPQRQSFYGAPTLAARLGLGAVSGPTIMQACATSVACVHAAAASGSGVRLVVLTDRTSNGPHVVYPSAGAPGGTPQSENWVLDSFGCDPNTGEGMLATAERVAAEAGFAKEELDEVTARRWSQYEDALAGERAFQKRWMVPIVAGSRRKPEAIDADWGVRPAPLDALAGLPAVEQGGVVSYGSQTHPADGCAGLVITSADRATGPFARVLSTGFARVARGEMPKAPVPAAAAALNDAGLAISDVDVIKTHNPFAVNDLWFARETGADVNAMNPFGCSLIYGHPQGPTGARGLIELMWALHDRGGGRGLFTGCAAGDTGAAVVIEVV
jgi:acetyl-CoA C-acetyltransferase